MCVCKHGSWGPTCSKSCPGGSLTPCNNHGHCNSTTGTCSCDPRWRGDTSCGTCTLGWTGSDCTLIVINEANNITSHAFSLGVCISFDGLGYINTLKGHFHLMRNPSKDLYIQAKYSPCHRHYNCIETISIQYGGTAFTVIAARTKQEQVRAYVNNTYLASLSNLFTSPAGLRFSFTRESRVRLSFVIESKLIVNIRAQVGYLDVSSTILDTSFCVNSSGLWGSCNNNSLDDLLDYNSSLHGMFGNATEYNSTSSISSVTQDFIRNVFIKSWSVNKDEDVLIRNGLNSSSGPSALRVDSKVLRTDGLFTTTGSRTSIEVFVRVKEPGVVWTYSYRHVFGLILNNTVLIFQGSNVIDTGLSISFDTWFKISVTFDSSASLLKVFTVDMNGIFNLRTYVNVFSKDTFYPSGVFTIGGTYLPASGIVKTKSFVGDIYQIRIWNKTLSTDELRTQVSINIPCSTKELANMWRFEQMQDPVFLDCVADVPLKVMPDMNQTRISWRPVELLNVYETNSALTVFTNTENLERLERECKEIITAYTHCIARDKSVLPVFTYFCIRELWFSGNSSSPYHTIAMMSEFCINKYKDVDPLKCQFLESYNRETSGLDCSKRCIFGHFDSKDNCICLDGFFGQTCQSECPGGFDKSCYRQGACDKKAGHCDCKRNFAASSCIACATNWTAADCGIVYGNRDGHAKHYTCQSFKNNLIGFSASGIHISSPGEFHLVKTSELDVQGRYVPCDNRSLCLHSIGLNIDGTRMTVYNPNIIEKGKNIWVNGHQVTITHAQMLASKLQAIPISSGVLKIITDATTRLNITVMFLKTDLIVTIESEICHLMDGLCGACDSYRGIKVIGNTSEAIMKDIMQKSEVANASDSTFLYHEPPFYEGRSVSDFGHMIHLNNTGISSGEVQDLFRPESDFTIEMYVKLSASSGTLISYSSTETTGIVVSDSYKIYHGFDVIDCKIKPKLNVWIRLVFAYNIKLSILSVYQFSSRYDYQVNKAILKPPLLQSKGHIQIGYWKATNLKPTAEQLAPFYGFVDEVRIWNRDLDQFYLESLHRADIPLMDGLKAYWKFNEAQGRALTDQIANLELRLPKSINPLDVWRFSDQKTATVKNVLKRHEIYNETLKHGIDAKCTSLIYHKDMEERCGNFIGKAFVDYFYLSCINEGFDKNDIEGVYPSIVAYISYCHSIMSTEKWPRLKLCDVIPSKYYPSIAATDCVIPCVFGTRDFAAVSCVCDHGYWGTDCSKLCPGGKTETCSGKGDCNVTTGACDCQENWKGNYNCSACTPGWTGTDCQLVVTPEPPSSVCSFYPGGHLVTLNAVHTTFYGHGEFYLLGNGTSDVKIHVHEVPCLDDRTRCIAGVALKTGKHLVSVKAPSNDEEDPEILINSKPLQMAYIRHDLDDVSILRVESSLTEIAVANNTRNSLLLTLRNLGRELAITLKLTGKYCNLSDSLCSTCYESGRKLFDLSHAAIENAIRVPKDDLLLSTSINQLAKFRLRFKGVGVSSNVLTSLYFNRDITIELRFTATSTPGYDFTLFSVSGFTSFGVIVQRTLKLVVSQTIYDTTYEIEKDKVNQITLVYDHTMRKMALFYINNNGVIWQYTANLPPWFAFLEPMSTLVPSEWISGFRDRFFYPAAGFQGVIHEMRIWKHAYGFVDIKNLFEKKVARTDPDLLSLWRFDEGRGYVVRDLVSGVNFFMPPVASGPEWERLTVNENALPIGNDVHFPDFRKKQQAIEWCHVQIYSSPLYIACNALPRPSLR